MAENQEPKKSSPTMTNADYFKEYKELPKEEKVSVSLPGQEACTFLNQWKDKGVPFAAYGSRDDRITIMTCKDNRDFVEALQDAKSKISASKAPATQSVSSTDPEHKPAAETESKLCDTKINPDYYKSLDKEDRLTTKFPTDVGEKVMDSLKEQGVEYSAVRRQNDVIAVTVSKSDKGALDEVLDKAATSPQKSESEKSSRYDVVNPDYYKSLGKEDRIISELSTDVGEKVMDSLKEQGVEYSAVKRQNGIAITVSKSNEADIKNAEIAAKSENVRDFLYIDKEYYKSLPKEERFTRKMTETEALDTAHKLAQSGVRCSVVLSGEKSAVTVSKADFYNKDGVTRSCFPQKNKVKERSSGAISRKDMNKAAKTIHSNAVDKSKENSRSEHDKDNSL